MKQIFSCYFAIRREEFFLKININPELLNVSSAKPWNLNYFEFVGYSSAPLMENIYWNKNLQKRSLAI